MIEHMEEDPKIVKACDNALEMLLAAWAKDGKSAGWVKWQLSLLCDGALDRTWERLTESKICELTPELADFEPVVLTEAQAKAVRDDEGDCPY